MLSFLNQLSDEFSIAQNLSTLPYRWQRYRTLRSIQNNGSFAPVLATFTFDLNAKERCDQSQKSSLSCVRLKSRIFRKRAGPAKTSFSLPAPTLRSAIIEGTSVAIGLLVVFILRTVNVSFSISLQLQAEHEKPWYFSDSGTGFETWL